MNINPENEDALSGNLFAGGNSPGANPNGYNGSPLAAFQMDVIRTSSTPEIAASIGRDRTHKVRLDWEEVKYSIMREAVLTKFLTHLDIQEILLSTGDRMLVENSPTDYYWGCGLTGNGQNQLGKILASVRQEIRQRLSEKFITY